MFKRNITYTDFNGDEVTEPFYFNISKSEVIELEVEYEGGMAAMLERIVETNDPKAIIGQFKRIILLSYGEKSADGKKFVKNDELRNEFSQTAAFDALFMELSTKADAAATFITAVLPDSLFEPTDQDKPKGPPVPPT